MRCRDDQRRLAAQALALARLPGGRRPLEDLTPREFDVLRMLVSPASVHEIAQQLHLSVKTVHNLHYQIKSKLGVGSDIELAQLAMSWGLGVAPGLDNGTSNTSQSPA
jgi:DNA-binding NarL/FixJ family response regulator